MTKAAILKRGINNNFCFKLVFIIIYIKNNCSIKALQNLNPYETFIGDYFKVTYF